MTTIFQNKVTLKETIYSVCQTFFVKILQNAYHEVVCITLLAHRECKHRCLQLVLDRSINTDIFHAPFRLPG